MSIIADALKGLGCAKPMVVTGKTLSRAKPLLDVLAAQHMPYVPFLVDKEPTTAMCRAAVEAATTGGCDCVIGYGGGSSLDLGKAVAALIPNGGDPMAFLEVIGAGKKLERPSLPFVAVPTTAGTGAEVTKNSVLASEEHAVKVSLRSDFMLPAIAVVDPELTLSCPRDVTISCGLDAFTQCLEPFVSNLANPLTDGFCREGLRRAARSLKRAIDDGSDIGAREDMCVASLCGGLALANAKLGAVHGFAGPIGGMFPSAPHGAVCAATLAATTRVNVRALGARLPESDYLNRYTEVAQIITGSPSATALDGAAWIEALVTSIGVPGLSAYGVTAEHLPVIAEKAKNASSMKGNPIVLTPEELLEILRLSL